MRHLLLLLFAVAGGLTLSGIVANLYRMVAEKAAGPRRDRAYYAVMVLAGPSVLLENATRSFRKKECARWPMASRWAWRPTGPSCWGNSAGFAI